MVRAMMVVVLAGCSGAVDVRGSGGHGGDGGMGGMGGMGGAPAACPVPFAPSVPLPDGCKDAPGCPDPEHAWCARVYICGTTSNECIVAYDEACLATLLACQE